MKTYKSNKCIRRLLMGPHKNSYAHVKIERGERERERACVIVRSVVASSLLFEENDGRSFD